MAALRSLVSQLLDGQWHSYQELMQKTGLNEPQLRTVLRLFADFHMAETDEEAKRCRLEPLTHRVWTEDPEEA